MNYQDYEAEDFLMDESFRKWLLNSDSTATEWWENWLEQHPEKTEAVNEARQLANHIHFEDYSLSQQDSQQMWQTILNSTQEDSYKHVSEGKILPLWLRSLSSWQKVAAAFAGVMLVSMAYYLITQSLYTNRYQTAFGETRTILLPDSSVVILNANSQLRFSANWNPDVARKVWLEGEAFFKVRKQSVKMGQSSHFIKFTVHTRNLDVNVVGTEFNVNDRRGKTQVVLSSGKVQLDIKSIDAVQPVFMQPGEEVEVSEVEKRISKRKVNPQVYSSWKNNQFVFENTPLAQVAILIEDTYGLKVVFRDPAQAHRRIRGVIPRDNIDVLLAALTNTLNLNFTKENGQILIESQ